MYIFCKYIFNKKYTRETFSAIIYIIVHTKISIKVGDQSMKEKRSSIFIINIFGFYKAITIFFPSEKISIFCLVIIIFSIKNVKRTHTSTKIILGNNIN